MIKESIDRAKKVLRDWKGDSYTFGEEVLDVTGKYARKYGKKATLVVTELGQVWIEKALEQVRASLKANGVVFETINGARPNAPREDVYRISLQVARAKSEVIVSLSFDSPEEVDEMFAKAVAAGATTPPEQKEYPSMHLRSFQDLDGHVWEMLYMENM